MFVGGKNKMMTALGFRLSHIIDQAGNHWLQPYMTLHKTAELCLFSVTYTLNNNFVRQAHFYRLKQP